MDEQIKKDLEDYRAAMTRGLQGTFSTKTPGFERELVDIVVTEEPAPGLIVQVRHYGIPDHRILDIYIPAHAATEHELGILDDPFADDDAGQAGQEGSAEDSCLVDWYVLERLTTGGFKDKWKEAPNGHLYVTLYDDTFLPR